MYIQTENKKISITKIRHNEDGVSFSGSFGMVPKGAIILMDDDNREMYLTNIDDWLRAYVERGTLILTNTPESVPYIPTPYIPTVEELREQALQRIDGHCSAAIQSGVVVDGKRYSLSVPIGQINLSVAIAQADSGQTDIPFSAIDETKPSHYTAEQIKEIGKAANEWGLVNTTYYSYLKDWIERETDVDILNSVEYGSPLPDDLMQDLSKSLAGFGIDITKYAAMLTQKQEVQNENK